MLRILSMIFLALILAVSVGFTDTAVYAYGYIPPGSRAINPSPTRGRKLGAFSTEFDTAIKGRASNIRRASASINRMVIYPGQEFSYNEAVGPTTQQRGYKLGTIFVNGKKEMGYGGGVCQVSSTLYNAAANAGLTILERHDHSLPVSYVEAGKEAATSYGVKDFKFINELSWPIVIASHVDNGKITVSVNAI